VLLPIVPAPVAVVRAAVATVAAVAGVDAHRIGLAVVLRDADLAWAARRDCARVRVRDAPEPGAVREAGRAGAGRHACDHLAGGAPAAVDAGAALVGRALEADGMVAGRAPALGSSRDDCAGAMPRAGDAGAGVGPDVTAAVCGRALGRVRSVRVLRGVGWSVPV